jgi:hypothetical protein
VYYQNQALSRFPDHFEKITAWRTPTTGPTESAGEGRTRELVVCPYAAGEVGTNGIFPLARTIDGLPHMAHTHSQL